MVIRDEPSWRVCCSWRPLGTGLYPSRGPATQCWRRWNPAFQTCHVIHITNTITGPAYFSSNACTVTDNSRSVLCEIFSYDFPKIRNLPKIFLRSFENVGSGDWHRCVTTDDVTIQAVLVARRIHLFNKLEQLSLEGGAAPVVWNSLLLHLHSPSISCSQLRAGLTTHLFRQVFHWLFLWELLKRLNWTESLSGVLTSCHRRVDQWPVASTSVSDVLNGP